MAKEVAKRTAENLSFDEPDQIDARAVEDPKTYAEAPNTTGVEFDTDI